MIRCLVLALGFVCAPGVFAAAQGDAPRPPVECPLPETPTIEV